MFEWLLKFLINAELNKFFLIIIYVMNKKWNEQQLSLCL